MDIQAVIAEATANQLASTNPSEIDPTALENQAKTPESKDDQEKTEENNRQDDQDIRFKPDSELTPEQLAKREANRQSHLNSKHARLRRENRELRALLQQQQSQNIEKKAETETQKAPVEADYDNLLDYLKAVVRHEQQVAAANQPKPQQNSVPQPDPKIVARVLEITKQEEDFIKEVPEYSALTMKNKEFFEQIPAEIQQAFLLAENAPLALYALMKDDRLDDLEGLSPAKLAMEIGKAEERGKIYISQIKKKSTAPAPIGALKGKGSPSKELHEMDVDELMRKFRRS